MSHSRVEGGEGGAQRVMESVGAGVGTGVNGQRGRVATKRAPFGRPVFFQGRLQGKTPPTPFSHRSLLFVSEG